MFWIGLVVGLVVGVVAALLISRNNKIKAGNLAEKLNSKIEELEAKVAEQAKALRK
jgi:uncharacterized membrane-anchored protein YhcB (DUF1043 family)